MNNMNWLNAVSLNQLADYVFVGGTAIFFVMFVGVIGAISQIRRNVKKIKKIEERNQEILLSQITVLKQIRDGRYR